MTTHFTQVRGEATGIDAESSAPASPVAGQTYFDTTTGRLYIYTGMVWDFTTGTTTSTSTTSSSTSSTSSSSSSTSSTSTSSTSSSSSTSSTSTSTTLI